MEKMTTKLIKRDTNWELYQNESLIASTFDTDLPTITFSDEVAKELGVDNFPGEIAMLALSTSTKIIKYLNENGGEDIRLGELIVDLDKMFLELISKYRKVSDNVDKKFTLEDMRKAIELSREQTKWEGGGGLILPEPIYEYKFSTEDIIQSLTKEEYFCEFDREIKLGYAAGTGEIRPKITNNSVKVLKICK